MLIRAKSDRPYLEPPPPPHPPPGHFIINPEPEEPSPTYGQGQCLYAWLGPIGHNHGLINYKDTKTTKCRLFRCLTEFIDWSSGDTVIHLVFSTQLLSGSPPPPPPPPFQSQRTVYTGAGGWGDVELCWRPYSAGV